ncbi:hypothetical protein F5148DRAFT_761013 [Russula earlei]|uniref:Uncharacterized protein n=1 Tax=Russula earlei TaxID=71964 RepID=A0ACC0UEE2_9AGAM|nr:hypothetical protein F5148DRAFT_761013 [Russula earlei]
MCGYEARAGRREKRRPIFAYFLAQPPLPPVYDNTGSHDSQYGVERGTRSGTSTAVLRRRFSKTQEREWAARIAQDVRKNERATDIVKRWLPAIALSNRREFCNFVPPLNDESFQLFVRFFWLVKAGERPRANQLLADGRRKWGLESRFHESIANRFLESGGDYALSNPSVSYYIRYPRAPTFKGKAAPAKARKISKIVGHKRSIDKRFSSTSSKRLAVAQPGSKEKRRLSAKARLTLQGKNAAPGQVKRVRMNKGVDVTGLEAGTSDLAGIPQDGRGMPPFPVVSDCSLVPGNGIMSRSIPVLAKTWPSTSSIRAEERALKRASMRTAKSSRKRRCSIHDSLSPRPTVNSQNVLRMTEDGAITKPDRDLVHTEAREVGFHVDGRYSLPPLAFDNAGTDVTEDVDDPFGCALEEYPGISSVGSGRERRVALPPRPLAPLPVIPPIWAQSRQEVCESLDSFRSFQGGVYHSNDTVKGYLLGAHSSSRDLFHHGGRLIISHGGGKAEALHAKNRRMEIQGPADQLEDDRSVRALLNNYKSGRPLVILADDKYALFPFDLTASGYTYVVLGLYWIAHAWAELQQVDENHSVVRYKFAFQWCEGQGDPWWQPRTEVSVATEDPNSQLRGDGPGVNTSEERKNSASESKALQYQITRYFCPDCKLKSLVVYQGAPMCLQPSCVAFFREYQTTEDFQRCTQTLSYSTELLQLRPANHLPVSADSLFPPSPSDVNTTSRPFAKGLHCRDCGRLSTRFKWECYECSYCHRVYEAPRFIFSHKDFWLQEQALKFFQHRVAEDSGIVIRELEFRSQAKGSALLQVQTFDLPHNRGHVHLIPGHPSVNMGANALFLDYQKQAASGEIQFRRWPLRAHKCRGQLLSNYFSQNTGAPYQYIGGAERTTPLEDGAKAVLDALALIKDRITTALGRDIPFNEVLSAAYMEKQKMTFHSDSERGLGPVVASLSLGSAAEMHFRLHSKYTFTEGHRKVAMSLLLRHGDVLVMEGAGVQEYYEHAVVPKNFRIVATARFISPENYT